MTLGGQPRSRDVNQIRHAATIALAPPLAQGRPELSKPTDDIQCLQAHGHDPPQEVNDIARVVGVGVGVVDDARVLVCADLVPVDDPVDRGPTVDLVLVGELGMPSRVRWLLYTIFVRSLPGPNRIFSTR